MEKPRGRRLINGFAQVVLLTVYSILTRRSAIRTARQNFVKIISRAITFIRVRLDTRRWRTLSIFQSYAARVEGPKTKNDQIHLQVAAHALGNDLRYRGTQHHGGVDQMAIKRLLLLI